MLHQLPRKVNGDDSPGLTPHTTIRAHHVDGDMRFLTVAGPILRDAIPQGSHFPSQDPAANPVNPHTCAPFVSLGTVAPMFLFQQQFLIEYFTRRIQVPSATHGWKISGERVEYPFPNIPALTGALDGTDRKSVV